MPHIHEGEDGPICEGGTGFATGVELLASACGRLWLGLEEAVQFE